MRRKRSFILWLRNLAHPRLGYITTPCLFIVPFEGFLTSANYTMLVLPTFDKRYSDAEKFIQVMSLSRSTDFDALIICCECSFSVFHIVDYSATLGLSGKSVEVFG